MAIQDYFNQTVAWQTKSGLDKFGNYSWSSATNIVGRLELKKTVLRQEGDQIIFADGVFYTKSSHNIKTNDRIIYTDSTGSSRTFEVIEVYEARGKSTLHHKKIMLKYANV